MIRTALASIALVTAIAGTSQAQQPAAHTAAVPDSIVKKFVGVWEGSYASDHAGTGGLRVEIGRDSVWTIAMDIIADQAMSSRGSSVRVEGSKIFWSQQLMGMNCDTSSTVGAPGKMEGGIQCSGAGVTFTLKRRD